MDRRDYWKKRYADKRAAGVCAKGSCKQPADPGLSLCTKHRKEQSAASTVYQRRIMLEQRKRERLPEERSGVTMKFNILATEKVDEKTGVGEVKEVKVYVQTGEYDDGRLGEIFVKVGKPGAQEALFDQWATMASVALQYGAGVEEIFSKARHTAFEPAGSVVDGKDITSCTSVIDLVAQWVIKRYAHKTRRS